jgi:hypothetical protein
MLSTDLLDAIEKQDADAFSEKLYLFDQMSMSPPLESTTNLTARTDYVKRQTRQVEDKHASSGEAKYRSGW